ncbi:MAG TPA: hypothetical protein VFQ39_07700 [Longimicrobium sp.]|nr:hypothetical protein [Longimicrobium sp.]
MSLRTRILRRLAFSRGAAQAFDLSGAIGSLRLSRYRAGPEAVRSALDRDWRVVHRDLRVAGERLRAAATDAG